MFGILQLPVQSCILQYFCTLPYLLDYDLGIQTTLVSLKHYRGSGQYGRPVAAGPPPNSGGYGGPAAPGPPPNGHGNPPPPQQYYGMPPPPRYRYIV